jgi:hypothetical protein
MDFDLHKLVNAVAAEAGLGVCGKDGAVAITSFPDLHHWPVRQLQLDPSVIDLDDEGAPSSARKASSDDAVCSVPLLEWPCEATVRRDLILQAVSWYSEGQAKRWALAADIKIMHVDKLIGI